MPRDIVFSRTVELHEFVDVEICIPPHELVDLLDDETITEAYHIRGLGTYGDIEPEEPEPVFTREDLDRLLILVSENKSTVSDNFLLEKLNGLRYG